MPYFPAFKLSSYDALPEDWQRGIMASLVDVLIETNRKYLYDHPFTPSLKTLIASGRLKYEFNYDTWKDLGALLEDGTGDCKDLTGALVAEYRMAGIPAATDVTSRIVNTEKGPLKVYHVRVRIPDGRGGVIVEDPSRWAGMPTSGGVAPGMGI